METQVGGRCSSFYTLETSPFSDDNEIDGVRSERLTDLCNGIKDLCCLSSIEDVVVSRFVSEVFNFLMQLVLAHLCLHCKMVSVSA